MPVYDQSKEPDPIRQAGEGCTLVAAGCVLPILVGAGLVVAIIIFALLNSLVS